MGSMDMLFVVDYCIINSIEYCRRTGCAVIEELQEVLKDTELIVAIDQSTVHTGMAIADAKTDELLAALDLQNWGFESKQGYNNALCKFLKNNLKGLNIKSFIYEAPLEHSPNFYTKRILHELRDYIAKLPAQIDALTNSNMYEINNLVWKKHFLKSDDYRGLRSSTDDVKISAMIESVRRFPYLKFYVEHYTAPPDCCDAIGIIYGFLEETRSSFNKNIRKPNRVMQNKGPSFDVHFAACSIQDLRKFCSENIKVEYEILEFNPTMTIEENCQRYLSVSDRVGVLIVASRKALQILKWETNLTLKKGETILVICNHR